MGSNDRRGDFRPDYAVPPGETVLEAIQSIGMSQAELAKRLGRPLKTINEIIKGKAAITAETALQLERVLNVPASLWRNLESDYRGYLADLSQRDKLASQVGWLDTIPVQAMVRLGWIERCEDKAQQVEEVLRYFGVASEDAMGSLPAPQAAFRKAKAFGSDPGSLAAWLRKGELEAHRIDCKEYSRDGFADCLKRVRRLTVEAEDVFKPLVQGVCSEAGVAVTFIPELPKSRVCGATRWLTPKKALIQLSFRYKTDDQLWFTFFHEAGHILLHGKKDIFIDSKQLKGESEEDDANRFAQELLIPSAQFGEFVAKRDFSEKAIRAFAKGQSIAPGIVVGQLQHMGHLHWNNSLNSLKRKLGAA
ncbi:MAG TPA: HigA family addiction module antitoxin [Bacillota bacterium]